MSAVPDHTQLFARIRVHGLTKSLSGDPCPLTLKRWSSFPAPTEVIDELSISSSEITDLSSRPLAPKFEVDTRMRFDTPQTGIHSPEGSLGSGRAGLVYPLEVVSIRRVATSRSTDSADEQCMDPASIPVPPLCIKVAFPGYARALAREAWFYEQIDANGFTGILAPRCYGVFRAEPSSEITVDIPGYDYYEAAAQPIYRSSQLYTSLMVEEDYDRETNILELRPDFIDDSKGSYASSA
jgi:hypothetical protein